MDLEDAILAVLGVDPMNTFQVHILRCKEMGLKPLEGGTSDTLLKLGSLHRQGRIRQSKNDEGGTVWSLKPR